MNTRRIAALCRELADAFEEEDVDAPVPAERKSRPRRKRQRAAMFPAPTGPVSEIDRQRARKMLRRRGISA